MGPGIEFAHTKQSVRLLNTAIWLCCASSSTYVHTLRHDQKSRSFELALLVYNLLVHCHPMIIIILGWALRLD